MSEHEATIREALEDYALLGKGWTNAEKMAPAALAALDALESDLHAHVVELHDLQNRLTETDDAMGRKDEALRHIEPLIDAQFDGHADTLEYAEKNRKLNEALDTVRAALGQA